MEIRFFISKDKTAFIICGNETIMIDSKNNRGILNHTQIDFFETDYGKNAYSEVKEEEFYLALAAR